MTYTTDQINNIAGPPAIPSCCTGYCEKSLTGRILFAVERIDANVWKDVTMQKQLEQQIQEQQHIIKRASEEVK